LIEAQHFWEMLNTNLVSFVMYLVWYRTCDSFAEPTLQALRPACSMAYMWWFVVFYHHLWVTCSTESGPEVMIGLDTNGGKKHGKTQRIFT
jgi:hypothetical protein